MGGNSRVNCSGFSAFLLYIKFYLIKLFLHEYHKPLHHKWSPVQGVIPYFRPLSSFSVRHIDLRASLIGYSSPRRVERPVISVFLDNDQGQVSYGSDLYWSSWRCNRRYGTRYFWYDIDQEWSNFQPYHTGLVLQYSALLSYWMQGTRSINPNNRMPLRDQAGPQTLEICSRIE